MLPYPLPRTRLTRARRLVCQICLATLNRTDRTAHLDQHVRDGRYFGLEPLAAIFKPAPRS